MEYDVIVAGIGGMGGATAAELAARGARVLGLERNGIPNEGGSSGGVNRIIRLAYAEDPRYVPLLRRAYERWQELGRRLGEPILITTGGVDIGRPDSQTVRGALASAHAHGLVHEPLDAEALMARYPGFVLPDDLVAVYQPDGGFVLSERAIAGCARLALDAGADLRGYEAVIGWEPVAGGVVVRTAQGEYRARRLVVSTGAWLGKLIGSLAPLAVPERQVLLWTRTKRPRITNKPDEHFIIDRLPAAPQVVVVSPCSGHGFKFASVVGEIAADLALDGGTDHDVRMFRIDRFPTSITPRRQGQ